MGTPGADLVSIARRADEEARRTEDNMLFALSMGTASKVEVMVAGGAVVAGGAEAPGGGAVTVTYAVPQSHGSSLSAPLPEPASPLAAGASTPASRGG